MWWVFIADRCVGSFLTEADARTTAGFLRGAVVVSILTATQEQITAAVAFMRR